MIELAKVLFYSEPTGKARIAARRAAKRRKRQELRRALRNNYS